MESTLNYQPVKSLVDVSFWLTFTQMKLDTWKLDNPKHQIEGTISLPMNQTHPQNLLFNEHSLKNTKKKAIGGLITSQVHGTFIHTNTIEEYQVLDLNRIIEEESHDLLKEHDFDNVNKAVIVSFGDLKNYLYHYKVALIELEGSFPLLKSKKLSQQLPSEEVTKMGSSLLSTIQAQDQHPFVFVLIQENDTYTFSPDLTLCLTENAYLCYFDPSPLQPSILLKNYLVKLQHYFSNHSTLPDFTLKILSIRDKISKLSQQITLQDTFYMEIRLVNEQKFLQVKMQDFNVVLKGVTLTLKDQLDPKVIAEEAVDLNLKLMKWRMMPGLNLEAMKQTKCLLLGSGSLGCQVARNMLSWGYRNITFVDYGKVSYSNPVRQCLFTFEDSQKPDNEKATIAAQRLQEIFPSVVTSGHKLRIPMPGHVIGNNPEAIEAVLKDLNELEELIKEHDAIFLLTDSRESRWLPTVISAVHNKICMTIALGFETFLVMRHGLSSLTHNPITNGDRLGCYFCNDVVAPRNSIADRTLDQQCTVSRPALCTIASSIGVELLTSMLNHPLRNGAKAKENPHECDKSDLGIIPQQIRGDLSSYGVNVMYGESFEKCIGCSGKIVQAYMDNKEEFVLKACNEPDFLEDLTGITAMMANIKLDDIECFDFDEEMN